MTARLHLFKEAFPIQDGYFVDFRIHAEEVTSLNSSFDPFEKTRLSLDIIRNSIYRNYIRVLRSECPPSSSGYDSSVLIEYETSFIICGDQDQMVYINSPVEEFVTFRVQPDIPLWDPVTRSNNSFRRIFTYVRTADEYIILSKLTARHQPQPHRLNLKESPIKYLTEHLLSPS
jgi:hypothetical protein